MKKTGQARDAKGRGARLVQGRQRETAAPLKAGLNVTRELPALSVSHNTVQKVSLVREEWTDGKTPPFYA